MKLKAKKKAHIKNQFILSVGDEGAILTHFQDGKLANKLFVESPISGDVKLIERLLTAYPKLPIYVLVDVIEQNYSQQVLPPVSSFSVKSQIDRRLKRDFQPNDLNNVLPLGRNKEGRKDWNFLFISLANTAPFSKWLEIAMSYRNRFGGVYLVPVEAMKFAQDVEKTSTAAEKTEWELFVFHNKVSGLRIVAFKNSKLIFTRLAQNLIGDNIAEIIVGNMEQEISNTVEYLKRLGFKGELSSKITIVSSADILQKIEPKSLKFGQVDILTPFQAAEKLGLYNVIGDKDKFADILLAAHFASLKKHVLKFSTKYIKDLDKLYSTGKAIIAVTVLLTLGLLGYSGYNIYQATLQHQEKSSAEIKLLQSNQKLNDIKAKKKTLPQSVDKWLEIMQISKMLPKDRFKALRVLQNTAPMFDGELKSTSYQINPLKKITYSEKEAVDDKTKKNVLNFELSLSFDLSIAERDQDKIAAISAELLQNMGKLLSPKIKVAYTTEPKIASANALEQIQSEADLQNKTLTIPTEIKISGADDEI